MLAAVFRFHGELNDFLAHARRQADISVRFNHDQSVKHLIESLGVPHTQVGRVLVSGQQVDFSYLVRDGDRVEVYSLSIEDRSGEQLGEPRFVVDIHLGRLAVYLRMLGFDTLYRNDYDDDELAQTAGLDERILLTRDQRLLMRNQVRRGYWVRSKIPRMNRSWKCCAGLGCGIRSFLSSVACVATVFSSQSKRRLCCIALSRLPRSIMTSSAFARIAARYTGKGHIMSAWQTLSTRWWKRAKVQQGENVSVVIWAYNKVACQTIPCKPP
jgi:hypothetical protein